MAALKPTPEQAVIVEAFAAGEQLVVEAGAGSGKTSTLKLAAGAAPTRRGLYLAYNRAIKDDAARSFPASVECRTSHGLAYGPVATRYKHRINGRRVPARLAAQILGINEPVQLAKDLAPLAPQQLARIAIHTVDRFCHSADDEISRRHVPLVNGIEGLARAELAHAVVPIAQKAWRDLNDPAGQLRFTHDCYLKIYQLSRPKLTFDYLLVDEAQDLNPVVQAIVDDQTHAQVVLVGDRCQAIYGWRGAVDAMAHATGRRLYLSQSFRFGDEIAGEANKWLSILDARLRLRGFDQIPSTLAAVDEPDAILCRSNAGALARVMDAVGAGRRAALVGGGGDLRALAEAAEELQRTGSTNHPELLAFTSWRQVQEYVEQDQAGSDLQVLVRLIDTHGTDTIVRTVDRLVDERHGPDLVVSTAHKAKGREWRSVRIATDFREPRPGEEGTPGRVDREEAMLAYVAVTRAQRVLDRSGLAWVDQFLPFNPAQPTFGELLDASSLGDPEAVELRAEARQHIEAAVTGMPDEQADWDGDEQPAGAMPAPESVGYCYRCGCLPCRTCDQSEAARWSAIVGLPAGRQPIGALRG